MSCHCLQITFRCLRVLRRAKDSQLIVDLYPKYIRMGKTSSYNTQLRLGLNAIILIYRRVKYYKIHVYLLAICEGGVIQVGKNSGEDCIHIS